MTPQRKWQVVRVVTRLNVGGPARHALLLTRLLAGEHPTLLAVGRVSSREGEMTDPEVPIVRVPLVRPIRPVTDLDALMSVRSLLRRTAPRIVHTHMAKAGVVGRIAALGLRERPHSVHTFHGHVLDGYFSPPAERLFLEIERRLARHTDILIAVSIEIRDALLDLGIGRPEQYRVIPVGLDLDPYLAVVGRSGEIRAKFGLSDDVPLIGTIGRLVPVKDHLTLFRALQRIPHAHLAVIGDGDRRSALEASVRTMGIGDRVHFTGWCKEVPSALADLDVVALSSRNEGTPVALIEALAAARAVVATDVGGVRSVVADGQTGLLVGPADSVALSDAMSKMLRDPDMRHRMGDAGRKDVRMRFGKERLVQDMRTLYGQLLSS